MRHELYNDAFAMDLVHIWHLLSRLEMHETVLSESRSKAFLIRLIASGSSFNNLQKCKEMFLRIRGEDTMGTGSLSSSVR